MNMKEAEVTIEITEATRKFCSGAHSSSEHDRGTLYQISDSKHMFEVSKRPVRPRDESTTFRLSTMSSGDGNADSQPRPLLAEGGGGRRLGGGVDTTARADKL